MAVFGKAAGSLLERLNGIIPSRFKLSVLTPLQRLVPPQPLRGRVPGLTDGRFSLAIDRYMNPFVMAGERVSISGWALDLDTGRPLRLRGRVGGRAVPAETVHRPDLAVAFSRLASLPADCGTRLEVPVAFGVSIVRIEYEHSDGDWRPLLRLFAVSGRHGRAAESAEIRAGELLNQAPLYGHPSTAGENGPSPVSFDVVIQGGGAIEREATLASLQAQDLAPASVIRIAADGSPGDVPVAASLFDAITAARSTFVIVLRAGDRLRSHALRSFAGLERAKPGCDVIYADEDSDAWGAPAPFFKPDWSPDTLESFDYLGAPVCVRVALVAGLSPACPYDLALMATERAARIEHLPEILCRRSIVATTARDQAADLAALEGRLARTGRQGRVQPLGPDLAGYSCLVDPIGTPLVSIVIPTAGRTIEVAGRRIDLILHCITSIRERSTYTRYEIIVVKNDDMSVEKQANVEALGCRLVAYERPHFNISEKINLGLTDVRGEYVVLMNDDMEIVAPDWIERFLAQAQKPHVGLVGAKLVYPHGDIQHAGVVVVRGDPDHVRQHYPANDLGYYFSTAAARNYIAVTGACTMMRTDLCREVGGYTEGLAVSFNDVDLCLKVRRRGFHVVYEPLVELVHFESASRVAILDEAEHVHLDALWGDELRRDPFYDDRAFPRTPPAFEPRH